MLIVHMELSPVWLCESRKRSLTSRSHTGDHVRFNQAERSLPSPSLRSLPIRLAVLGRVTRGPSGEEDPRVGVGRCERSTYRGGNCELGAGVTRFAVGASSVNPITAQLMSMPTLP